MFRGHLLTMYVKCKPVISKGFTLGVVTASANLGDDTLMKELNLYFCQHMDDELAHELAAALPGNTHLRSIDVDHMANYNGSSSIFPQDMYIKRLHTYACAIHEPIIVHAETAISDSSTNPAGRSVSVSCTSVCARVIRSELASVRLE